MYKYWKIGTSLKKYVSDFLNMNWKDTKRIGFIASEESDGNTEIIDLDIADPEKMIKLIGKTSTVRQKRDVWNAIGFIRQYDTNKFKINEEINNNNYLDYIKKEIIFLTNKINDEQSQKYLFTLLINILACSNIIKGSDLKDTNTINYNKVDINKIINEYSSEIEKELSNDIKFIRECKERFNEIQ